MVATQQYPLGVRLRPLDGSKHDQNSRIIGLDNPSRNSWIWIPEPADFPNFNQFFLVQRFICGKNYHEETLGSFCVKLLTVRQTDKQTDNRQTPDKHDLIGEGNHHQI